MYAGRDSDDEFVQYLYIRDPIGKFFYRADPTGNEMTAYRENIGIQAFRYATDVKNHFVESYEKLGRAGCGFDWLMRLSPEPIELPVPVANADNSKFTTDLTRMNLEQVEEHLQQGHQTLQRHLLDLKKHVGVISG